LTIQPKYNRIYYKLPEQLELHHKLWVQAWGSHIRKLGRPWYGQTAVTRPYLVDTVWYFLIYNYHTNRVRLSVASPRHPIHSEWWQSITLIMVCYCWQPHDHCWALSRSFNWNSHGLCPHYYAIFNEIQVNIAAASISFSNGPWETQI
jgi:hypothetical protein